MKHKNIIFLGTSHISKESYEQVKSCISHNKPDIIALELDNKRLPALFHKRKKMSLKSIRSVGIKGFIFSLIGAWAERKLGELTGFAPGSEMKMAIELAKANNISVALIDQDIEITLKRLSKYLTWKEKLNFFADIIKAIALRKKEFEFDITKVPERELIKKLLRKVRLRYPNVYRVLIEERNKFMFRALKDLSEKNTDKKILAIMGAGHVDDILRMMRHYQ